jgi:IgA Peptidase M64
MALRQPKRGTPGLSLEVLVTRDAVAMRAAATIPRVDLGRLRAPVLVEGARGFDRPASELVLDLRAADGEVLTAFGWPAAAETFHTEISLRTGELAGSPMRAVEWEGRLRVPADERVAFLVFALRPGPGPGPLPPLPLPPEPLPPPWRLPQLTAPRPRLPKTTPELVWVGPPRRRPHDVYQLPGGHVHEARTIVDTGDPADRFDIVIIGEGFAAAETDAFDARADLLCHGLLSTPPFSSYRDRINVHAVSTVSVDSGITNVPALGTTKRTYLSAEGYWEGKSSPTFIGTHATRSSKPWRPRFPISTPTL